MVQPTPQSPAMLQSTPQRSGMVQRTPQRPAMVQALPEQAQAVRSPAGPPRTVAEVSPQGAGQTLAERRHLAEIMSQVTVAAAEKTHAVAPELGKATGQERVWQYV